MDLVDENKVAIQNVGNWYTGKHIKKHTILGCPPVFTITEGMKYGLFVTYWPGFKMGVKKVFLSKKGIFREGSVYSADFINPNLNLGHL